MELEERCAKRFRGPPPGGMRFPHTSTRQFDWIILRTIALLLSDLDTQGKMARYSAFLGRSVEVQYRAGDILLPASGTFVADSGRSIFLEQTVEQRGQHKHFRWEIPYQYLVRIEEKLPAEASVVSNANTLPSTALAPAPSPSENAQSRPEAAPAAAGAAASQKGILPLPHRPKPA